MTKDEYQLYLESPYWRERRLQKILSQHLPGVCEDCHVQLNSRDWSFLNVHHLNYERMPFRELDSDLVVLCKLCHGDRHGIKYEEVEKILNAEYSLTPDQVDHIRHACHLFDGTVDRVETTQILVDLFNCDFVSVGESQD